MSLPKEYINELNGLNKEVQRKNPQDILQFCFNYFQQRLEEQRKQLWLQEPKARAAGLTLFPSRKLSSIHEDDIKGGGPLFKNSFINDDPHSKDEVSEQDANIPSSSSIGNLRGDTKTPEANAAGIFKSGFHVGEENKSNIANTVDPMASSSTPTTTTATTTTSSSSGSSGAGTPGGRRTSHVTPGSHHHSHHSHQQQGISQPTGGSSGLPHNIPSTFNANRRTSVSAETLNPNRIKDDWKPPFIAKTPEQLTRLSNSVVKNFLFSSLDEDSLNTVIGALEEVKHPAGTEVIKQGDEGDYFYVVESGTVNFFVNGEKVNNSGPGSSFGELALMYNSPRAATAIAETDLVLWALDRLTFRRILLAKTSKKRQLYESFLKEVPVLSRLSLFERSKLADALETESYKPGEVIIKEGEVGENFYLIIKGEADILKNDSGLVGTVKRGDYFGEVALLNDLPRQASVIAKTDVDVATLDKRGFQRLLGPAVEVLKRQDPTKH